MENKDKPKSPDLEMLWNGREYRVKNTTENQEKLLEYTGRLLAYIEKLEKRNES